MTEKVIWGVHMSRDKGSDPVERGYVAIGWHEVGDLSMIKPTREAFKAAYAQAFPDSKPEIKEIKGHNTYLRRRNGAPQFDY